MKRVVVGMSGGVDSSVCAYLLKVAGYEVIGLFMRNWDSFVNNDVLGNDRKGAQCPQEVDYQDALHVANQLKIPLHRVDFIEQYWNFVFQDFLDNYRHGYTPNPDILCNKFIKFDAFLAYAVQHYGADYIAMGHYAKINNGQLLKPKDQVKDQTYFLAQLQPSQLEKVLFPLANLTKSEVRDLAKTVGLITANKKDSTGICFIGERKFQLFLKNYIPAQKGDIVNIETNLVVGQHDGIMYYTVGQRKGLNLGGMDEPFYVVGHNLAKQILYVAPHSNRTYLQSTWCQVGNLNIIGDRSLLQNKELTAKFRYRQSEVAVRTTEQRGHLVVHYQEPVEAVTPGQQCVFYYKDQCLGGGIIQDVFYNNERRVFY